MDIVLKIKQKLAKHHVFFYWILNSLLLTKEQKKNKKIIDNLNIKSKKNEHNSESEIILMPFYDDAATMKMLFQYQDKLFSKQNNSIKYFYALSPIDNLLQIEKSKGVLNLSYKFLYRFNLKKISKIYHLHYKDIIATNFHCKTSHTKFNIDRKGDLLTYTYKGILLGDLIYDTYLRHRSKATIDLQDKEWIRIFNYAHILVDYWEDFFLTNNKIKVFVPYTAYIHWGVISRVGFKSGIQIILFGNSGYHLSNLSNNHLFHSKNYQLYPLLWEKTDNKEAKKKQAAFKLEKRLQGDTSEMKYMRRSSFTDSSTKILKTKELPTAVIFLHCFFDSPHIYGDLLFPDFYEWIEHLLNYAKKQTHVTYYVKPHPNGLPDNDKIIVELKNKYEINNIIFLPKYTTNNSIIDLKPNAIFTVYGTVAHEFAYLGFPVVTAGSNPHSAYHFLYNPKTISELDTFICNVGNYGLPSLYKKDDILEFYYMHYLYYSKIYNFENSNANKDFTHGEIELPEQSLLNDLIYY